MHDLLSLAVIVTAFGGLAVIGILILLSGLFTARRTSSVIACAAAAATLFAMQLGSIYFWHSFGVGFGGEGKKSATILAWGSVAAVALVVGFLGLMLPWTVGKTVETAHWLRDGAKISAAIIVAYVLYLLGGVLLRWSYPPGGGAPPISPATWVTALVGLLLAWGLWRHRGWAWYAALVCSAYVVIRTSWLVISSQTDLFFLLVSTPVGVRLLLLVLLLGVLLFSNARRLCVSQTPSRKT